MIDRIATIMQLSPYDKLSFPPSGFSGNRSSQSHNCYVTGRSPPFAYLYLYCGSLMKRYYLYDSPDNGVRGAGAMRAMPARNCGRRGGRVSSASENFCAPAKSAGNGSHDLSGLESETQTHSTGLFCSGLADARWKTW